MFEQSAICATPNRFLGKKDWYSVSEKREARRLRLTPVGSFRNFRYRPGIVRARSTLVGVAFFILLLFAWALFTR